MKYYAQFFNKSGLRRINGNWENDPNHKELLGSDGVLVIDGRLSLFHMKLAAEAQIKSLKAVQKITGYEIRKASRFSGPYNLCYRSFGAMGEGL